MSNDVLPTCLVLVLLPCFSYSDIIIEREILMQKYIHLVQIMETEKIAANQLRTQLEDQDTEIERLKAEVCMSAPASVCACIHKSRSSHKSVHRPPQCKFIWCDGKTLWFKGKHTLTDSSDSRTTTYHAYHNTVVKTDCSAEQSEGKDPAPAEQPRRGGPGYKEDQKGKRLMGRDYEQKHKDERLRDASLCCCCAGAELHAWLAVPEEVEDYRPGLHLFPSR